MKGYKHQHGNNKRAQQNKQVRCPKGQGWEGWGVRQPAPVSGRAARRARGRGRKPLKRGSPLRSKPSIDSCMPARISCGQTACGSRDAHAAAAAAGATPADDDDSDTPLGTCCEAQTPPPTTGSTLVRRPPVTSRDDDTVRQRELATVALRHSTSTGLYYMWGYMYVRSYMYM